MQTNAVLSEIEKRIAYHLETIKALKDPNALPSYGMFRDILVAAQTQVNQARIEELQAIRQLIEQQS